VCPECFCNTVQTFCEIRLSLKCQTQIAIMDANFISAMLLAYIVIAFEGILEFDTEVPSALCFVPQFLVAEFDARGEFR